MTHIPRAVCVGCGREMKTEKQGMVAQALATFGPYYKIEVDKLRCELCGYEILCGWAQEPLTHHFYDGFDAVSHQIEFVFAGERYADNEEEKVAEGIRVLEQHLKIMESKLASARMVQERARQYRAREELQQTEGGSDL